MDALDLEALLKTRAAPDVARAFAKVLATYTQRGFGSATKADLDAAMFDALVEVGVVRLDDDLSMMRELRVTQSRLMRLPELHEVRTRTDADLTAELREVLVRPVTLMSAGTVRFRVRSPLLRAHIQALLAGRGCATDTSFSRDLLAVDAVGLAVLLEACWTEAQRSEIQKRVDALQGPAARFNVADWLGEKVLPTVIANALSAALPGAALARACQPLITDVQAVVHLLAGAV